MNIFSSFVKIVRAINLVLALAIFAPAHSANRPTNGEIEDYIKGAALIGFESVYQPLNRILLLRSSRTICAIRFLSYSRGPDARRATPYDTGDASEFAAYEMTELTFKGAEVLLGPVIHKELDYRGMRGLGRLAFGVGNNHIRCGGNKYSWLFPTGILLKEEHVEVSIAPTNWENFNNVRLNSPKLRWYQRDPQLERPFTVIPIGDLPP